MQLLARERVDDELVVLVDDRAPDQLAADHAPRGYLGAEETPDLRIGRVERGVPRDELRHVGEHGRHGGVPRSHRRVLLRPALRERVRIGPGHRGDVLLRRLDARRPVDQRLGVQVEVVLVRVGGADVAHHPVRVAPQRVLEVDRPVELLGRPGEERGHVGVLLPRPREAEVVAVLRLEVLLVLRVVEQILAVDPDLVVAVERDGVVAAGVLVLHRDGDLATGEVLIPVRLVLGRRTRRGCGRARPRRSRRCPRSRRRGSGSSRPASRSSGGSSRSGRSGRSPVRCSLTFASLSSWSATLGAPFGNGTLSCPVAPFHMRILRSSRFLPLFVNFFRPENRPAGSRVGSVLVPLSTREAGRAADHAPLEPVLREVRVPRRGRPRLRATCEPSECDAGAGCAGDLEQLPAAYTLAFRLVHVRVLDARVVVLHAVPSLRLERLSDIGNPACRPYNTDQPARTALETTDRAAASPPSLRRPRGTVFRGGQRPGDRLVVVDAAAPETAADRLQLAPRAWCPPAGRRPARPRDSSAVARARAPLPRDVHSSPPWPTRSTDASRLPRVDDDPDEVAVDEACRSARPRAPPG